MNAAALPTIRTLLCHAHVPMALRCFASLRRCHQPPFRLLVHDDGTLTASDCAQLAATLPGTSFVRRTDADGPVLAALEKYPACRRYRDHYPLGLKLFDVPLLAGDERVVYCDSDIYYLRPFTGFHRLWETTESRLVFTRDIETEYAIRYFHTFGSRRIPLVNCLNSGIMLLEPGTVDLDFLEWVLTQLNHDQLPGLVEQTCWAAQAARSGPCRFLSPQQVGYPLLKRGQPAGRASIPADRVMLHFVSPLRNRLAWLDGEDASPLSPYFPPVDLTTIPTHLLSAPEYAFLRSRKQLRYWRSKFL